MKKIGGWDGLLMGNYLPIQKVYMKMLGDRAKVNQCAAIRYIEGFSKMYVHDMVVGKVKVKHNGWIVEVGTTGRFSL